MEDLLSQSLASEFLLCSVPVEDDTAEEDSVDSDEIHETRQVLLAPQLHPESGSLAWVQEPDMDAVCSLILSRSQMGSMLLDTDRNHNYAAGITDAIQSFVQLKGRPPIVLDIGTGTGLLSMYAARAGAAKVIACEMYKQTAEVATKVVAENHFDQIISVVGKKSTELAVGVDLDAKVDIIITETLDTGLLGEAIIPSLRDALQRLAVPDCVVVPHVATVYAQIVQCPMLRQMTTLPDEWGGISFSSWLRYNPSADLIPIHQSNIVGECIALTEPTVMMQVDFSKVITSVDSFSRDMNIVKAGQGDAVLWWWTVDLGGGVIHSSKDKDQIWQDHWLQAAAPQVNTRYWEEYSVVTVQCLCTDTSITFKINDDKKKREDNEEEEEEEEVIDERVGLCTATHALAGPHRIEMFFKHSRLTAFVDAVKYAVEHCDLGHCFLDIGDGGMLALMAGRHQHPRIGTLQEHSDSAMVAYQMIVDNHLEEQISILQCSADEVTMESLGHEPIGVLAAEPFYSQLRSMCLWTASSFWLRRTALNDLLDPRALIIPSAARVMGFFVEFCDLWKSHSVVGEVDGFRHQALDELIEAGLDCHMFYYQLTQYDYKPLTAPTVIMHLPFTEVASPQTSTVSIPSSNAATGTAHALVLWVEYQLTQTSSISTLDTEKQSVLWLPMQQRLPVSRDTQFSVSAEFNPQRFPGTGGFNFDIQCDPSVQLSKKSKK